jgi:phosphatidylserine/phosphatidylglycerophosphate/cardiolipin synthase-like enzyme
MTGSEIDDPSAAKQSPHPSRDLPRLVQLLAGETSRVTQGAAESIEKRIGGKPREVVSGQARPRGREESHASILSLLAPARMRHRAAKCWGRSVRVVNLIRNFFHRGFTARNSGVRAGGKWAEELAKTRAFQMVPVLRVTRRLRALQPSLPASSIPAAPEWLIDNAEAYDRMLEAIGSARHSVWMTQLAFDADCVAYRRDLPGDAASPGAGTVLAEALVAAVARAPVDVRILLNATLLLDTTGPLRRFFVSRLDALKPIPGTVRVRGLSRFPQLQHSKMVIVDGNEAFLLGSPFANGYWDDRRHAPVDARRPARELGGRPLHDVSVRLTGSPVAELQRIFAELWSVTAPGPVDHRAEEPAASPLPSAANGESTLAPVRIVCTSPARVLAGAPGGATQIVDALLDGIAAARALVYVEHQYLSARRVVSALAQALRREPDLELIVVLNQNPDVTAYQRWQNARLGESGLLEHPRAGVFALWSVAPNARGAGPATLNQVFVHSKVVVVDDLWATGGSANLDGVSLHAYGDDFTGTVGRRIFRNVRNLDVNVVVRDGTAGGSASCSVADLRARLWSEHLGLPLDSVARRPADGWLRLWRARAAANVAALSRLRTADEMRGFVLPYSAQRTPALQLSDLGLHLDPARIDLRFNPGWLEVHFSPKWVRNMFA